jgi:hypothetical protein
MSAVNDTAMLTCANCAIEFPHPATRRGGRVRRFCTPKCRVAGANARRASTRTGRLNSTLSTTRKAVEQPIHSTLPPMPPSVDRSLSDHHNAPLSPPLTHRNGIAHIGDRVRIWVDSPVIGSGERHLLITTITRTHVKLFSVAALREITITRSEFEGAESYGSNARIVLGLLETGLRSYARLGLEHDRPNAHAMDALREQAK